MDTLSGFKDIGIRKFELVAKIQFLLLGCLSACIVKTSKRLNRSGPIFVATHKTPRKVYYRNYQCLLKYPQKLEFCNHKEKRTLENQHLNV